MTIKTRGTTFSIGTTAANHATDTYTEIAGARVLPGQIGTTWATADVTTLKDDFRQDVKTLADAGSIDLTANYEPGDAGQTALSAANDEGDDDTPYNFKIAFANGDIAYVKARVMSFTITPGGPTNVIEMRSRLRLTKAQVYEAA